MLEFNGDLIALAIKISKVRELVKSERQVDLSKKEIAHLGPAFLMK